MSIKFSSRALARLTTAQRDTLLHLSNDDRNELDVHTAFELPGDYVAFYLWYGSNRQGQPIYGGIDKEGRAST